MDQFPKVLDRYNEYMGPRVVWKHAFSLRAQIALNIIETTSLALIAGKPEGEDSSGRAITSLQTPREVVVRALEIADIFVTECAERKWVKSLDELEDIKK